MLKHTAKFFFVLLFTVTRLHGQNTETDRLFQNELKMNLPSIYFKHNSTDYATMPYTPDSCFKYIALHIKDINDFVIWRDSLETEKLTTQRIKKLKAELRKYKITGVYIKSMKDKQKLSRRTIEAVADSTQMKYLLSLNSVFEIAQTRLPNKAPIKPNKKKCLPCWMDLRLDKSGREHCKLERKIIHKSI